MSKYASITLSFDHFHPTAQLVPDLFLTLCQTKIAEREEELQLYLDDLEKDDSDEEDQKDQNLFV